MVSLSNSALDSVLQFSIVKHSLFNEERRRNDMGRDNAQALVIESREKRAEILKSTEIQKSVERKKTDKVLLL